MCRECADAHGDSTSKACIGALKHALALLLALALKEATNALKAFACPKMYILLHACLLADFFCRRPRLRQSLPP